MRKHCVLISFAMLTFALLPNAVIAEGRWKAAAVSNSDKVYFAFGESGSEALRNALQKCKAARRSECRSAREKSIAVESRWWLVVAECKGKKFLGGSQRNADVALEDARNKAPAHLRESCLYDRQMAGTVPPVYDGQGDADSEPARVCWAC
jgi:hypothetical protein